MADIVHVEMKSDEQNKEAPALRYTYLLTRIRLPFRIFIDDGLYHILSGGRRWRLSFRTTAGLPLDFTTPPVSFGDRAQLRLDCHGYAGHSEVVVGCPLEPPLTKDEIGARQASGQRVTLRDALRAVNAFLSLYRQKTGEFWFRAIGDKDIPALSWLILPEGSLTPEWFMFRTNTIVAAGTPYLKTEKWYEDLESKCDEGCVVPFPLELFAEGRDALARDNLRLAASTFALSVEALFRTLLLKHFPSEDVSRPAEQMLGVWFSRFREIDSPSTLPFKKARAVAYFKRIWGPRDKLLHGHELRLKAPEVALAERSTAELLRLLECGPNRISFRVEGPFAQQDLAAFPLKEPEELLRRAQRRYGNGFPGDAEEAARYSLIIDPKSARAHLILAQVRTDVHDLVAAKDHFEKALALDPSPAGLAEHVAALGDFLSHNPLEREKPGRTIPEYLMLANRVFACLNEPLMCGRNWGIYLVSRLLDSEPELRNRIAVVWLASLISVAEAERRLVGLREEAIARSLTHLVDACAQIVHLHRIVKQTLGLFTLEEQIFVQEFARTLTLSWSGKVEPRPVDVTYSSGDHFDVRRVDDEAFQKILRSFYGPGSLDNTLVQLTRRVLSFELPYWRIVDALGSHSGPFYDAMLAGDRYILEPLLA